MPRNTREFVFLAGEGTVPYVVDMSVLGRIVFCFQCTEQSLLCSEDLYGTGGVFRQAEQAACMADEPRANKLADQRCQVWCNGIHAVTQVLGELRTIRRD